METLIDFNNPLLLEAMPNLLQDKTTKKNIVYASASLISNEITFDKEITVDDVFCLRPRLSKDKDLQRDRILKNAEVFTPAWVCNFQNSLEDSYWFGYDDVFNRADAENKTWQTNTNEIRFSKNLSWLDYIKRNCLELACGEAPYITSRYDASTGEKIDVCNRIGLLDRKLRVILENVNSKEDWVYYTGIALEHTYGFEYQGDNLFFARCNVLLSVLEYYKYYWKEQLSVQQTKNLANIISWNFWQMDGRTNTVPSETNPSVLCHIWDYTSKKKLTVNAIEKPYFDICVGNPPYQASTEVMLINQNLWTDLFSNQIEQSKRISLLVPGKMCFGLSKKPAFADWLLSNPHYHCARIFRDMNLFNDKRVTLPLVAVIEYDHSRTFQQETAYLFPEIKGLVERLKPVNPAEQISYCPFNFNLDKIREDFPGQSFDDSRLHTNAYKTYSCCFSKTPSCDSFGCLFRMPNKKTVRLYIKKKYIRYTKLINTYKIAVPRLFDNRELILDGQKRIYINLQLLNPGEICSTTFQVVYYTADYAEATNFLKYLKTKFVRALVGNQKCDNHFRMSYLDAVPMQDFTSNAVLNWNASIADLDRQLYRLYDCTAEEISFIESTIQETS